MRIDDLISVLQAAKQGKAIEQRDTFSVRGWEDAFISPDTPPFIDTPRYSYRVKPEPREWWLSDGCDVTYAYKHERQPGMIHVREVLP